MLLCERGDERGLTDRTPPGFKKPRVFDLLHAPFFLLVPLPTQSIETLKSEFRQSLGYRGPDLSSGLTVQL